MVWPEACTDGRLEDLMRPRERYLMEGPTGLSDAELLQLVLGSGGRGTSVVALASDVLERFGGVASLSAAEPRELLAVSGLGPAQAARVHAAVELGVRAFRRSGPEPDRVSGMQDARRLMAPRLRGLPHEELHGLFLDVRNRVVGWRALTSGSLGFTVVDPRQIFRVAVRLGAAGVILAHNHPSGDATPSSQDLDVTRRVERAGRVLGIRLLDHLVVGDGRVVSMAEQGVLSTWEPGPLTAQGGG